MYWLTGRKTPTYLLTYFLWTCNIFCTILFLSPRSNKGKTIISSKADEEESEGLALLIPDIQETASIVKLATQRLKDAEGKGSVLSKGNVGLKAPRYLVFGKSDQHSISLKVEFWLFCGQQDR